MHETLRAVRFTGLVGSDTADEAIHLQGTAQCPAGYADQDKNYTSLVYFAPRRSENTRVGVFRA